MNTTSSLSVTVIIPAYNEEDSIAKVIKEIPSLVNEIIVVNNCSTDKTATVAATAGATVLDENRMGYGYACLKGIEHAARQQSPPEVVVFLDGDFSDYPVELIKIIAPIQNNEVDFVVGARVKELREEGSMTPQQIFGNWLACFLMKGLFNSTFTDLGPFRAIKWETLQSLKMSDKTYGWTVEMQLKVLRQKISYQEIPVSYKKRIGVSKVSGTIKGTIFAGAKIIGWIFKHYIS
ncbi:glycosyltransferase family 2 protein [Flavobacteriaceae bacterium]|mgnify:FL=1|nr:glycosyltransferase family 2 protein [Flavobacteriaceae bacterium]MDA9887217.1 glycosyltransferase family 2 protein [Flavobacteriaceae bacterium]MDB2672322.1 glycosyltransferase family 2 protein [Flavobacteriaceae bacterium]MDB4113101.1 glycosyltransferase family 2 protein [Flavobacteriaceae bacterium]MDB4187135.1 glycosyltransferase family 2 protein [Flavobacteriaceae bacterium]